MKKGYSRGERVGTIIQQVISRILLRDISDPRLDMVTISGVEMSDDLRFANIYFTATGGAENVKAAGKGFQSAMGFIRKSLAKELDLRFTPQLRFYPDTSYDYGDKIERILKSLDDKDAEDN